MKVKWPSFALHYDNSAEVAEVLQSLKGQVDEALEDREDLDKLVTLCRSHINVMDEAASAE